MSPPSPVIETTALSGFATLHAERRREPEAERALVALGHVGARREHRVRARIGREADLRQLGDEESVARQRRCG